MCKKYDQTLVGFYNPDETVPFNTISDCIASSTVMSYSVDISFSLFVPLSLPPPLGGLLLGAVLASAPPLHV